MPAAQDLPSFNLAIRPDHYKTTLPNLLYPSRPSAHIRWSGSSAPLVFSVSYSFFFVFFCHIVLLFVPQKTRRAETVSSTNVQVSYLFFFFNPNFDRRQPFITFRFPPVRTCGSIPLRSFMLSMGSLCWFG